MCKFLSVTHFLQQHSLHLISDPRSPLADVYKEVYGVSYHGLGGESLDLLDGLWCTLLERDTMEL